MEARWRALPRLAMVAGVLCVAAASTATRGASEGTGSSAERLGHAGEPSLAGVDHAGLIRSLDESRFEEGRQIYHSICITCHGDIHHAGSLPTSRKFWEAEFKNGSDPYSLYLTLGNGFGQMPQFPFLSPRQRYDVIHYVREALVRPNNPKQYFHVSELYLNSLPRGFGAGEELTDWMRERAMGPQYLRMNFGPALNWTYEVATSNIVYKGIAVRLDGGPGGVSKGNAWMLYDHDTMRAAAGWRGEGFIDWKGIAFDGSHNTHASIIGGIAFENPVGPGWARPGTRRWEDPRSRGRDGRPYGPLPRDWIQYRGHYLYGDRVILSYTVGETAILESPGYESRNGTDWFTRTLNIGPSGEDLRMRVAPESADVILAGPLDGEVRFESDGGFHVLSVPAAATPVRIKVMLTAGRSDRFDVTTAAPPEDLEPYTRGGPARWSPGVVTNGIPAANEAAYVVDVISTPHNHRNPWNAWMRLSGLDFLPGGQSTYVCTWMGDVWRVDGVDGDLSRVVWTRVATGLFQPLGLIARAGKVYVTCRDQIVELNDLNADGEMDWYRCFNNDHQVTEHFHEFAMGLQTDAENSFYYAKSARHALPALVPHHGTLLKVSADGSTTTILANGFRAANGVCVNKDGSFFVTDQEGHWTPKNRINRVVSGGFYGNMLGYHDRASSADADMDRPMVWITNEMDRSPGELLWVDSSGRWGPLEGSLLNLSYGTGRIFVVPHEQVNGQFQGGVVRLPIPDFPTGVMRGRFHPATGQLYACGMYAWAGNQQQDGGFYRVRYTGRRVCLPVLLEARRSGIRVGFTGPLDRESAADPLRYHVKTWSLKRTAQYGSEHYDVSRLKVGRVSVSTDARSVFLMIPELRPTWCMSIKYDLLSADGERVAQEIHNTIHELGRNDE
jgi:hypothetical protein